LQYPGMKKGAALGTKDKRGKFGSFVASFVNECSCGSAFIICRCAKQIVLH
jgi:hypothetical protein